MNEINYVEGFPLNGNEVKEAKIKTFEILEEPQYQEFKDQETEIVKRRMILKIKFTDSILDYYPNKTSQAKIVTTAGRDLKKWVGYKGEFETLSQKVGKETKNVIYIK